MNKETGTTIEYENTDANKLQVFIEKGNGQAVGGKIVCNDGHEKQLSADDMKDIMSARNSLKLDKKKEGATMVNTNESKVFEDWNRRIILDDGKTSSDVKVGMWPNELPVNKECNKHSNTPMM